MKWFEENWWKLAIIYVVIGLLTFGNAWNESLKCEPLPEKYTSEAWDKYWLCHNPMAALQGAVWPIIFVGQAAIWITK